MCHTVMLSLMLGLREGSLRKLEEGERVVDSRSKLSLLFPEEFCFIMTCFRIDILVDNCAVLSLSLLQTCLKFCVLCCNRQFNVLHDIFLNLRLFRALLRLSTSH